jgi:integrase
LKSVRVGSVTVKIYPSKVKVGRKRYQQFRIAYYDHVGQLRRESRPTMAEAFDRAEKIAKDLSAGDKLAAQVTAERAASYARAESLIECTGKPIELIAAEAAEIHKILGGTVSPIAAVRDYARRHQTRELVDVSDAVAEMLAEKKAEGCSEIYLADLELRLEKFETAFPGAVQAITGPQIQRWLSSLRHYRTKKELGQNSLCNYRAAVQVLFEYCRGKKYIPDLSELDCVKFTERRAGKSNPYSPDEMRIILSAAESSNRPAVRRSLPWIVARAFSGIRNAEASRVRLRDFHAEEKLIVMDRETTKTDRNRTIPLADNLAAWLAPFRADLPADATLCGDYDPTEAMRHLFDDIGMKSRHNGLRDSYVSYRMALLHDAGKVSEETGHSATVLQRSYKSVRVNGQPITETLARDWFGILPTIQTH